LKIFSYILLAFFICTFTGYINSQSAIPSSPSQEFSEDDYTTVNEVSVRTIDSDKLNKYKNDPDFQYDKTVQYELTIWERIIEWIKSLLRTIFFTDEYSDLADAILYIVMGITVITIILIIYRTEIRNLFFKDVKYSLTYLESGENIHEINFEEMIEKQLYEKNYRFALRLTYLKLLKVLDSKGFIKWRNDKTNRELIGQIKHKDLNDSVKMLTVEFENVWYGGFDIDEMKYKHCASAYSEISEMVKQQ
jgi:hypothetical protein